MAPASELVLRGDVAAAASSSFDELAAASASFDDPGASGRAGGNGASGSGRPSSMVRPSAPPTLTLVGKKQYQDKQSMRCPALVQATTAHVMRDVAPAGPQWHGQC